MVNNYLYAAFTPDPGFTPPTDRPDEYSRALEEHRLPHRRTVDQRVGAVADPILHKSRTTDFDAMSDAELRDAFEEQLKNHIYMWEIHGWINLSLLPATALSEFYNAEIQPADPNEAWQLLQGYKTKSVDAGTGLWQLSRTVKPSPALSKVFELDPSGIPAALEASDEGKAFLERVAHVSGRVRLAQRRHLRARRRHLARGPDHSAEHHSGLYAAGRGAQSGAARWCEPAERREELAARRARSSLPIPRSSAASTS